jgi:hypothetical protein
MLDIFNHRADEANKGANHFRNVITRASFNVAVDSEAFVKGSLTRDFRLQVFFMNQCPPGLQEFHWSHFEFFQIFAEIFAN